MGAFVENSLSALMRQAYQNTRRIEMSKLQWTKMSNRRADWKVKGWSTAPGGTIKVYEERCDGERKYPAFATIDRVYGHIEDGMESTIIYYEVWFWDGCHSMVRVPQFKNARAALNYAKALVKSHFDERDIGQCDECGFNGRDDNGTALEFLECVDDTLWGVCCNCKRKHKSHNRLAYWATQS